MKLNFSFDIFSLSHVDFHSGQWKMNDETGKRERVCTYKVTVSAVFGSTTICSNERQVRRNSTTKFDFFENFFYSIDCRL